MYSHTYKNLSKPVCSGCGQWHITDYIYIYIYIYRDYCYILSFYRTFQSYLTIFAENLLTRVY